MNVNNARILVCDDEPHLREMVGEYLSDRGYQVIEAADAEKMFQIMDGNTPDLIILDINMPGEDGLTALRTIRTLSDVPVIMLTAAADVIDRVIGLEMGADDYLGKPVDLRELEARVKVSLRRRGSPVPKQQDTAAADTKAVVPVGTCRLDLEAARLFGADGNEMAMTAMEFSLLRVFVENRGRVLNRAQLLEQAHDRGWEPFDRSIDLRISRLRKKIESNPSKPETLRTVRGVGYIFG